eukprot:3933606-Rhodomonas_salina.1
MKRHILKVNAGARCGQARTMRKSKQGLKARPAPGEEEEQGRELRPAQAQHAQGSLPSLSTYHPCSCYLYRRSRPTDAIPVDSLCRFSLSLSLSWYGQPHLVRCWCAGC